jgi:hypothetical protein
LGAHVRALDAAQHLCLVTSAHTDHRTYTLTHAARCLTVDDLTDPSLTPALPLIDALRKVEWPESTLPVHPYSQSDVRLHTSAPLDSAEYSYAYCFHKDRFDIHVGDFISRGLTDGEFAR